MFLTMKYIIKKVGHEIKLSKFQARWSKEHKESQIMPMSIFPDNIVSVGRESYGELNVVTFNNESKLKIGNYVSIAQNVTFLLDVEHYTDRISTYPYKVKVLKSKEYEAFSKGDIVIEDDVWIGYGSTIMSGVRIGQGSIIASSAIVTKDVPAYAIVGGVPARVIKYRFNDEIINELIKIDYSKLNKNMINVHIDDLYEKIENKINIDWIPQKDNNAIK